MKYRDKKARCAIMIATLACCLAFPVAGAAQPPFDAARWAPASEYARPSSDPSRGPVLAGKSNLLYWASSSPNFGAEFSLAQRWSVEVGVGWNTWDLARHASLRHWLVLPEARYWFCRTFEGHFVGVHALYGMYDLGNWHWPDGREIYDHVYNGWCVGAGLSYGYHFPLGKRWGLELSVSVGYVYLKYDKYRCEGCREYVGSHDRHYVGPTKAAVNLVYMIH
ncbi:MAG: DUF3575 domain-containing protein [Rikenellaceae bacterium]|jgi:hypothetical protein|nr:DUF3575 domain-containing protein [Rikenellaceae bacterium]